MKLGHFSRELLSRLFHGVGISGRLLKISGLDMICDDHVRFRLRSEHHGVRSVDRPTRTKACLGFFLDSREQIAYAPSGKKGLVILSPFFLDSREQIAYAPSEKNKAYPPVGIRKA